MSEMHRKVWVSLSQSALKNNLQVIQALNGERPLFPVIKANAYGHDEIRVAQFLDDHRVQSAAVGQIEEGVRLRQAGVRMSLLVFAVFDSAGVQALEEHALTGVISTPDQLTVVKKAQRPLRFHLKVDCGMHRLGFFPAEVDTAIEAVRKSGHQVEGLMTHLSHGESSEVTLGQLEVFSQICLRYPEIPQRHAFNSAGLATASLNPKVFSQFSFGSRPGIALYGYCPVHQVQEKLQPVMTLQAQFVRVFPVSRGEGVSYNHTWKAQEDSLVGVVPVGYGDGYPRHLSNRGVALVAGELVPVIGQVCMDYLMVDLTSLKNKSNLQREVVTLWGSNSSGAILSVDKLAERAGSISWEILTRLSPRIPRQWGHS